MVSKEVLDSCTVSREVMDSRTVSKELMDVRLLSKDSTRYPSKESVRTFSKQIAYDDDAYEPDSVASTCTSPCDRECLVPSKPIVPTMVKSPPPSSPPSHEALVTIPVPPPPPPFVAQSRDTKPDLSPEELGKPGVASVGSAGHHLGLCKPCDFVFRDSCRAGTSCKFCHLCGPDESQRRKKEKKRILKGLPQWQRGSAEIRGPGVPVPIGVPVAL